MYKRCGKPNTKASYPASWSRTYQGHGEYWHRYTLNDNLAPDVIETLFLAADIYQDEKYRRAALQVVMVDVKPEEAKDEVKA